MGDDEASKPQKKPKEPSREIKRLSDVAVRTAGLGTGAKDDKRLGFGLHHDGGGLYLQVRKSPTKPGKTPTRPDVICRSWLWRHYPPGRPDGTWMGLGAYPQVSLGEARTRAREAHNALWRAKNLTGPDGSPILAPIEAKQARRAKAAEDHAKRKLEKAARKSFREVATEYHEKHKEGWRSKKFAKNWLVSLRPVFDEIGDTPIGKVDHDALVGALEGFWAKTVTAPVVLGRILSILDWSAAKTPAYRSKDASVSKALVVEALQANSPRFKHTVTHRKALPYDQVPALMTELKAHGAKLDMLFLRLAIATVVRPGTRNESDPGELLGATWDEFDMAKRLWTIPADRMKGKDKDHIVPLNDEAMAVLELLGPGTHGFQRLFPPELLSYAQPLKTAQALRGVTVHGFRSSFRDWTKDIAHADDLVAEACLAHVDTNKVQAAYLRSDLLARRARLMAQWSDYLNGRPVEVEEPKAPAELLPFERKAS